MATTKKKPELKAGDILRIPYGEGAIYARVIHSDPRDVAKGKARGVYMKVLDRDAAEGDDLAEVANAPTLLGPFQTVDLYIRKGPWDVVGNVALTPAEAELPYFLDRTGVIDFFYQRVPDTPENRKRVVKERAIPPDMIIDAVRAKRGHGSWSADYDLLSQGKS